MAHETDTSISALTRGVFEDARELFREEVALAKAEARHELSKAAAAGAKFTIAAVTGWFAVMFALVALALGVSTLLGWHPAVGFGVIAVLLGAAAAGAYLAARRAARDVQPLPRTVNSMKENFR